MRQILQCQSLWEAYGPPGSIRQLMVDKFRKAVQTGDPDVVDLLYRSLPGEAIAVQAKSWERSRRWQGERARPLDLIPFREVVDALLEEQPLWNHRHNPRQQGWVDGLRVALDGGDIEASAHLVRGVEQAIYRAARSWADRKGIRHSRKKLEAT